MTRALVGRLGAVVFALAWFAYGAALAGDFVFDDIHSVAANPALHDLGNLGRLLVDPSAFSATDQRMYRPVLLVSFALNFVVAAAPWALKAGNVLLHASVAWLLWSWLRRSSLPVRPAFVAAALFAVHPLASEAVNLVSARSELLLAFGVLLALRAQQAWQAGAHAAPALLAVLVGTAIACGSKETGVVLPALLAVQEIAWWRQRGGPLPWRRALAVVLPVAVLVLGYLALRRGLLGQATVDLLTRGSGDPTSGHGRALSVQLATMGTLLPQALLQVVAPWPLSLDPPVTFRRFADPFVLVGWASVLGLSLAAAWSGRRAWARRTGLALAWLLALPWIVVPLNAPLAEHRLYGPMLGLALLAACVLPRLRGRRWQVVFAALLLLGVGGSVRRSLDYRSEVTLWRAELAQQPRSFAAWWGLGAAHLRTGDAAAAIEPLATAHLLRPLHLPALRHYAEALVTLPDAACQPFRSLAVTAELQRREPDDPWARTLVAQANLQAGAVTGAAEHYDAAEAAAVSCLQIAEPKGYVYRLAAAARRGRGDLVGALAHLDTAVARGLVSTALQLDRAAVLKGLGRHAEARRELLAAQARSPMDPAVQRALLELAVPPR